MYEEDATVGIKHKAEMSSLHTICPQFALVSIMPS